MQISRVKRTKSTAKRTYDHLSRVYDLLAGSSETQFIHLGLEMLAVKAGETILEIGSGTGKALLELCTQVGDQGKVNGLDLSPGMLRVAHNRLGNAGVHRQVSLLMGDSMTLPYKKQAFSVIFMSFTLELFDTPEIPLVLAETNRVLQPDGRLGVVSMLKSGHPGRIVRLYEWFHKKLPAYVDCRPIDAQAMIQEAGFSLQKQQVKNMWGLPVAIMVARKK